MVDLRRGEAVHGVAGNRLQYRAVASVSGDPLAVVTAYTRFGCRRIYIADLDAIEIAAPPSPWITKIAAAVATETQLMVDVGWRGNEDSPIRQHIAGLAQSQPAIQWIAASESARDSTTVERLAECVGPASVWLGLDYAANDWISPAMSETEWLAAGERASVDGCVVLDVRSVGSHSGPTMLAKCRELAVRYPQWRLISGGGVRTPTDAHAVIDSGCEACLVATAIHPLIF